MAVKCGIRQIKETDEFSFLVSAIKEGRRSRRRLQMQLAQPKTICIFGLPSIIAYSQINITVPRPVRSDGWFLQDSYIWSFSLKTIPCRTPPNCLLSNPHYSHRFQIFMHIKQLYFVLSKTSCVRMTKMRKVQNSGPKLINLVYL